MPPKSNQTPRDQGSASHQSRQYSKYSMNARVLIQFCFLSTPPIKECLSSTFASTKPLPAQQLRATQSRGPPPTPKLAANSIRTHTAARRMNQLSLSVISRALKLVERGREGGRQRGRAQLSSDQLIRAAGRVAPSALTPPFPPRPSRDFTA